MKNNRIELHIPDTATELQRERVNDLYNSVVKANPKALVTIQNGIYPEHRSFGLVDNFHTRFNYIFEPETANKLITDTNEEIKRLKSDEHRLQSEIAGLESDLDDTQEEISELENLLDEILND